MPSKSKSVLSLSEAEEETEEEEEKAAMAGEEAKKGSFTTMEGRAVLKIQKKTPRTRVKESNEKERKKRKKSQNA